MHRVPSFKSHLVVAAKDSDTLLVLSERERRVLTGPQLGSVARLIDGRRTREDIVAALDPQQASAAFDALDRLEIEGYTREAAAAVQSRRNAFWDSLGAAVSDADERLRTHPVSITAYDDAAAAVLARHLHDFGIEVRPDGGFCIVIADDYLNPDLAQMNRDALRTARPWMLAKPIGVEVWIGPIFVPGRTACWRCLSDRLKENRWLETAVWGGRNYPPVSMAELPATSSAALALAATETAKWLVLGSRESEGRLWSLDLAGLSIRTHLVRRRPQCPECGHPAPQPRPAETRIESRPAYRFDSGYRTCSPEATLDNLEQHVSPITGLILETGEVRGPNPMLRVWTALHTVPLPAAAEPARVAGKGFTASQAKASCLAEAIERYSSVFRGDEPRIRARCRDLESGAVHPAALLNFSSTQYLARSDWNRTHAPRHHVPEPFDENLETDWTPAWSLTHNETRYLPAAYCYLRYPAEPRHRYCRADSNGCAAGNVIEEAILQGLLELVERDAAALWWYSRARRPGLARAALADALPAAQYALARAGRPTHLLDITTDLRIPVFVAVSSDSDGRSAKLGLGSHLDPRLAAARALSELYQAELGPHAESEPPDRAAPAGGDSYLAPSGCCDPLSSHRAPAGADLAECIQFVVDRAAASGLEVLVVNLTRPEVGFPVVRVVVPGLRHLPARFGPGRLYDVPPALGWVARPLVESELNPVPFPL